jgi:hypothetical protein
MVEAPEAERMAGQSRAHFMARSLRFEIPDIAGAIPG